MGHARNDSEVDKDETMKVEENDQIQDIYEMYNLVLDLM